MSDNSTPVDLNSSQEISKKTFWAGDDRPSVRSEDLDVISNGEGGYVLAMLERRGRGRRGGAFLLRAKGPSDKHPVVLFLGPAGEYAARISTAKLGARTLIAWHEGVLGSSNIRLALVDSSGLTVEKTKVLRENRALSSPALVSVDGKAIMAWAETARAGEDPRANVRVATVKEDLTLENPVTVAEGRFMEPSPNMTNLDDKIGIVYRDDEDHDETPEYHYFMLDKQARPILTPRRISKADGLHGPAIAAVGKIVLGAAVRSFQRNLLVGLNRFNRQGVKLGGEFQLYADKTDFVRVDLAATEDHTLMVYAEDRRAEGRVLAARISCQ